MHVTRFVKGDRKAKIRVIAEWIAMGMPFQIQNQVPRISLTLGDLVDLGFAKKTYGNDGITFYLKPGLPPINVEGKVRYAGEIVGLND